MKGRKSIKSTLLALLLSLAMIISYMPAWMIAYADDGNSTTAESVGAATKAAGDSTVLAFTSDVHNGTRQGSESNVSANRLDTWLSNVQPKYNNAIKVMGFCGDMASAQSYDANYWGFAETVMNRVSNNGLTGVYAVGNHEYANGHMNDSGSGREDIQGIFTLNKEGRNVESDNYRIYCLGTNHGHGSNWAYEDSQITALTNYLNSASNDKVTIILTHFPLHDFGMHKTSNTAPVLNTINDAVAGDDGVLGTGDDKKIVYLWGHNHSEGDTNYDQVWLPGNKINDTNKSTVNFYYAAAGSMADSEYGQSGSVKGKGLVLEIDDQKRLAFTYYDANGNNVTEPDSETISEIPQEPVAIEDVSITNTNLSVRVGKTLQLSYSTTPKKATVASATWNSNKESVATVDQNGKVTAVSEGTATITLTVSDGLSRATATTSAVVTVTAAGTSEEHTVSVTPSTSNPEETIHIEVGDTLVINTTNGSSNSAYDFTASLSKSGVAEFQGSSSQNIAAGGTGQFTVEGAAEGSVDITIQNSNSYGSQYARKATIHLTVGEGGDTPVDPPTGDTVNITPTTDNPEESIKINVGDTLTINVTNGSSNSAYDFTATLSNSGIAQLKGNATVNIAAGGTGQFTVEGLADGTVDITIQNSNTYGSQYARKGVIHLTVGEGGDTPVDPPTGDTVNITPTTDNPEESIKINVGDTLTINVTNGSSNSAYDFTATLSNSGIAQLKGNATVNIAAGGTGQFTVEGLADGTVDITIQNSNTYGSQYARKGVIHLTVGEGGDTPVDPPTGDTVNITPTTDNPEESIKINIGDTLTINVTNGSSNSAYDFTASLSNSGIAQLKGNATVNIAAGSTGQFTVEGLAEGTVDITIQNSNTYGSQYTRKGVIHLTVGESVEPDAITLSPATLALTTGKTGTLTATVTPAGANKTVTWESSNTSVATVANGVVTAVAQGSTTITAKTVNNKTATCAVTVTDPEPGAETTYVLTDTLEDGKEYLIANGNSGSVYILSNESGGSRKLNGVATTVTDGKITISEDVEAKTAFTAELKTSTSGSVSAWLKNNGKYLYTNSNNGLTVSNDQTSSDNTGKFWHYKADGKNLLWYFKDTNNQDGYTDTTSTYKYYLSFSNGAFTDDHASTTSLANTTTPAMYIFVKDDGTPPHTHTYGDPTWAWTGSDESGYTAATATFTCTENDDTQTVNATVTSATSGNTTTYTATATFNGSSYTDTKTVTVTPPHTHTYGTPTWSWANDYSSATATFTCAECGESTTVTDNSPVETVVTAASCTADKVVTYTATVVLDGSEHSKKTGKVTVSGTATGHRWSDWTVTKQPTCTEKGTETRSCSICNEVETRDIDATGHDLTAHEAVAATCTTAGNSAYWSCSKCNKFFSDANGNTEIQANSWVIDALGHKLTKTDGVAATCTTAGNSEYWTCSVCGKFFSDGDGKTEIAEDSWILPAKGHTLTKTNAVAATCLEGGNEAYWTCSVCGKFFGDGLGNEEIEENSWKTEALGHNWSEWKVTTPATELEEGVETRTCSRCGETETRTIEKLTHVHQLTPVAASEPTCEEAGNTAYWFCNRGDNPCGKYFSDANGEHEITEIGSWIIPALGHDLTAHEAVAATCTEDGNYAYWSCSTCGKYFSDEEGTTAIKEGSWVIPASGHDWGEPIYVWANDHSSVTAQVICNNDTDHVVTELVGTTSVTTEPTCEEAGETVYTSNAFKSDLLEVQTMTVPIAPLGHDWGDWEVVTPATETSTGVEERTCSVCKKTETRDIPVLGHEHKLSHVDAVEATCTEPGVIEYWICDQGDNPCGKIFGDAGGTIELNTEDLAVPVKDHTPGEAVVENEIAATCETAGSYEEVVRCVYCGEIISREVKTTEALGHDWGKWEVTTPATKEAAGVETRKCSRCDATETRPIDKLAPEPGSDPNQKGSDGTAVGPGASAAAAEAAITGMKSDTDPKGAAFGKLTMRSPKQTNKSITLKWTKVQGASKYVIYGHKCGKTNKPKKLYTVTGNSMTLKKVAGASIKKGTYYKFIVVALDKNNNVVTTSKLIHVATKGGKVGNHKSVTIKKAVLKKAMALKKGKSLSLKPTVVPQSKKLKVKKHVGIRYESSNKKVATVSSSGKITAKSKGTCYVYVFAQSGVFKKVKVVVK